MTTASKQLVISDLGTIVSHCDMNIYGEGDDVNKWHNEPKLVIALCAYMGKLHEVHKSRP